MAAAQPDMPVLAAALHTVANQVELVPNIPAQNVGVQLQNMQNLLVGMIHNLSNQMNDMNTKMDMIPLQLHNCTLSPNAPLRLPAPIAPAPPGAGQLPQTPRDIQTWNGPQINGALISLGLNVPQQATVEVRRRMLADRLGCPHSAW